MRIGFIGLGLMGKPIATNLVKDGLDVVVHNRSQGKVQELVALGATAGTSPRHVAEQCDIVLLCLQGGETVELVLAGLDGVLEAARPGLIIADHSTIGPGAAKRVAGICAAKGVTYLDAPVSGTGAVAWSAGLTIMVGGDRAAYEQVQPYIAKAAKYTFHTGPVGSGNIAKMSNNLMLNTNQAATMEALVLGAKLGVDLEALYEVVGTASGDSRQWQKVTPGILRRDFTPSATIASFTHGEENVKALADSVGAPTPMFDTASKLWHDALAMGLGAEDPTAAIKVLEQRAGVEVRGRQAGGG